MLDDACCFARCWHLNVDDRIVIADSFEHDGNVGVGRECRQRDRSPAQRTAVDRCCGTRRIRIELDGGDNWLRRACSRVSRRARARSNPAVDPQRVAVSGGSQGGGITLAAAYLCQDVVAALPDVPFLCAYRRAMELIETAPYSEITRFLKTRRDDVETVFNTLSYFDGVNFSAHAKAQALFSVGLMDDICPPSTVFAAYNHYAGPKQIEVYQYNNHEGGEAYQTRAKMRFLQQLWG